MNYTMNHYDVIMFHVSYKIGSRSNLNQTYWFQFVVLALGYYANVQCSNGSCIHLTESVLLNLISFTRKASLYSLILSLKHVGFIYCGMVRWFALYLLYTHTKAC